MALKRGYALLLVLFFLVLLSLLSIVISENVLLSQKYSFSTLMEIKALNAADGGVAFALEAIRQSSSTTSPWWSSVTSATANWNLLESHSGMSVCFKIFPVGSPNQAQQLAVTSYGEVVKGSCGDYFAEPKSILSARTLTAKIDLSPGQEKVSQWQEVLP